MLLFVISNANCITAKNVYYVISLSSRIWKHSSQILVLLNFSLISMTRDHYIFFIVHAHEYVRKMMFPLWSEKSGVNPARNAKCTAKLWKRENVFESHLYNEVPPLSKLHPCLGDTSKTTITLFLPRTTLLCLSNICSALKILDDFFMTVRRKIRSNFRSVFTLTGEEQWGVHERSLGYILSLHSTQPFSNGQRGDSTERHGEGRISTGHFYRARTDSSRRLFEIPNVMILLPAWRIRLVIPRALTTQ